MPGAFAPVVDRAPDPTSTDPADLGEALRLEYRECVEGFRQIVNIASLRRETDGSVTTHPINLGVRTHDVYGSVACTATLNVREYRAGNTPTDRRTPFLATTTFMGQEPGDTSRLLAYELLGAEGCNMHALRMPNFVRMPDSTLDRPWNMGEDAGNTYDHANRFPWTSINYLAIRGRLLSMMVRAQETQEMLIEALQDRDLNPRLAEAAAALSLGASRPVII
jgi:hypothetical protein